MISFKNMVIAGTLVVALALSGCSSTKPAEQAASDSNQKPAITESKQTETKQTEDKQTEVKQTEVKQTLSIAQGAQNMRDALKEMKEDLNIKNEDKAIKTSEKLEENWSAFEDSVKDKSAALYEKVEDPLGKIQGGVKVKPLDTKTLTTAMNELDQVLTQVQQIK